MSLRTKKKVKTAVTYFGLILVGVLFLLPALWLVLSTFNRTADMTIRWPREWTLENLKAILERKEMLQGFGNSMIIAGSVTIIIDLVAVMAAYPLSRFKTKWGSWVSLGLLFMTALPASAMMISTYKLLVNFHMIDSLAGVILLMSAGGTPYAIWMMKNFMDTVSVDLEEAAWIDGASRAQATIHVLIPLMLPGFITVTTYNFISAWGNFYTPFIMLTTTSKMPASVNIYRLYGLHGEVIYGQVAAYSILYIIPIFVLYYFSQDHMSKGFSMGGAAKG